MRLPAITLSSIRSLLLIVLIFMTSCVSERKFQDEVSAHSKAEMERAKLKTENVDMKSFNSELESRVAEQNNSLRALKQDTAMLSNAMRRLTSTNNQLNDTYERLLEQMNKLREGSTADTKRLTEELQKAREEVQVKEDALRKLELTLAKREGNLDQMSEELKRSKADLENQRIQLQARSMKISELESVLSRKDSAVVALKDRISDALLGFADQGLTVEHKNGKVYVSLDEKLLFSSGSWVVDEKGKDALNRLAKVLETQPDVGILIEGHTDNVPYKGNGQIKDNWDLSVMRATAIVRILTADSAINPAQLAASGRSEYMPLDTADTKEARAMNRRTEIIITPKLDELFKLLDNH